MLSCRGALGVAALAAALGIAAAPAGAYVPPGRTLELVTPTTNPSAKVDVLPFARVAGTGNRVAFQVLGNRDTGPANTLTTYLSTRTGAGWTVKQISPPEVPANIPSYELYPNPVFMFNSDMTEALLDAHPSSTLVAGEPNADNLYEENLDTGAYTLLTPLPPFSNSTLPSEPRVAWASPDLQHVLFDNDTGGQGANYFDPSGGPADYAYLWTPSTGTQIASVENTMSGLQGISESVGGAGALSPASPGGQIYISWYGGNPHAISDDGSRIYYTVGQPPDAYGIQLPSLAEVRNAGQPSESAVGIGNGKFITASTDGHEMLFTSCTDENVANSTAFNENYGECRTNDDSVLDSTNNYSPTFTNKNDLYLWNEDGNGGAGSITDLTTQDPNGADVMGVLGASSDLSRVYFVARGNLTGTAPAPNDSCRTQPGQAPNLYSWDKTDGIRFIAQLVAPTSRCFNDPAGDITTWQSNIDSEHKNAQVSPDGSVVAFTTEAALDPSYDNVDADTGLPHREVYFYKYGSAGPICVSCVGTGPATADATIANQQLSTTETSLQNYPDWQKQNLLPDDNTLFFESGDKLSAAVQNTADSANVYEYSYATGSVTLISSGASPSPSNFMGATADGSDVFFSTDQSLLPSDVDNNVDIYDARLNGGVPNTPPAGGLAPPLPPPTSTFVGPGNPKPGVVVPGGPKPVVFALGRLTSAQVRSLAKTGAVTLTITAPGAGKVSAKALARLSRGGALKTIGSASVTARKAGVLHLTLRLSSKARATLKKSGQLAVTIQASFGRATKTLHITIKRP
jgi:hypothetical protein